MENNSNKYLRAVFSKGSIYDIPVSTIVHNYARKVIRAVMKKRIEDAVVDANNYFNTDSDHYIEYASNGMDWFDVLLTAKCILRRGGEDKNSEWRSAKKILMEY